MCKNGNKSSESLGNQKGEQDIAKWYAAHGVSVGWETAGEQKEDIKRSTGDAEMATLCLQRSNDS